MLTAARDFVFSEYGLEPDKGPLPMGQPSSLLKSDLPCIRGVDPDHYVQYVVSPKADGDREVLGWFKWKQQRVSFHMNRKGRAKKLPITLKFQTADEERQKALYMGTLFDAEMVTVGDRVQVWIFDVISINGHNLRDKSYHFRLAGAVGLLQNLGTNTLLAPKAVLTVPRVSVGAWDLFVKPIWALEHLGCARSWKHLTEDGMIFTPLTKSVSTYRSREVFKWKPVQKHTVDFLVRSIPGQPEWMDLFVTDEKNQTVPYVRVPLRSDDPLLKSNSIYECRWADSEKTWYVHKLRLDKEAPNAKFTADATCQNIAENLSLDDVL